MSALLTAGFIPTAAIADDAALSDQQIIVDAIVETVDIETTEADTDSDIMLDEVVEPVEPTPTEGEVDSAPNYTGPDPSLETVEAEAITPDNENLSPESGIEYPPPENSSDKETIYVVEDSETEDLFDGIEQYSFEEKNILEPDFSSSILTWDNLFSEEASYSNYRYYDDYIYTLVSVAFSFGTDPIACALILGYTGKEHNIIIPGYIHGYPVIVGASFYIDYFKESRFYDSLTFSEGVLSSDTLPHSNYDIFPPKIGTINLPSTWKGVNRLPTWIGPDKTAKEWVVCGIPDFYTKEVNVSTEHSYLCSVDGVVYDKDMTTLLFYPGAKENETFTIPSSVEDIRDEPFRLIKYLKTLNIPDSVTSLDYNDLLCYDNSLETINIGKGLEYISSRAFGYFQTIQILYTYNNSNGTQVLTGYKNCTNGATTLKQVNIDPENPYLTSENGVIYNRDKTDIYLYLPNKMEDSFTVPKSVSKILSYAFSSCPNLKKIVFTSKLSCMQSSAIYECQDLDIVFLDGINPNITQTTNEDEAISRNCIKDSSRITMMGDDSVRQTVDTLNHWNRGYDWSEIYYSHLDENQEEKDPDLPEPVIPTEPIIPSTPDPNTPISPINPDPNTPEPVAPSKPTNPSVTTPETPKDPAPSIKPITPNPSNPIATPTQPYNPKPSATWIKDSTGWWYRYADGSYPKNTWAQIDGTWYHFNKSGYMQTGWQNIGGTWYYLNPSGAMATGWTNVGGTWYYLKPSGAMATGWQQIGGAWYYLNGSGAMQTGWYKVGPHWYYSNGSGVMQSNRWIGNYYVGASGAMATSQWVGNYYVDANGLWVK